MAGVRWESASVKAQLRLTTLRLGQLQEKKDSQGAITRRDIATLLQQRNVVLARAKVQNLQHEDALGDLLESLEMHLGQLLEHFHELDQCSHPTPNIIEAASTVIYAAPYMGSKDLEIVSDILSHHLGSDFTRSAIANDDGHVAPIAVRIITATPPSAQDLDLALQKIASDYSVIWTPEPLRQDILNQVSEILDPQMSPVVDLPRLRRLCRHGIPDEPKWLRPRIWKLFFGVLPVLKVSWDKDIQSQRESYYDLTRRLLEPFSSVLPSQPTSPLDVRLLTVSEQLSTIPSNLLDNLAQAPGSSDLCPLDDDATEEIKVGSAKNLDIRLQFLRGARPDQVAISPVSGTTSQSPTTITPEISLSSPDVSSGDGLDGSTTLLTFKPTTMRHVHPKHSSALLRLLYMHASINPGNISPHIPSLLVPLYATLNQEIIPEDLAHAEADTFWLFEAMVGEFSELEDEEGGTIWMKRFSDRLAWADTDLFSALQVKGLDPALPHFSYRWLAPLLTHTLPLSSVLPIWDALFSRPMRTRDINPKIDYLLDVCTTMLMRARAALFRLGKSGRKSPSLWTEEQIVLPPPSPLRAWELGDAFVEGMSFLQLYPVEAAGGIDTILQGAFDLAHRRDEETKRAQTETLSLSARIKVTMWKGFTNQEPSPNTSPEESEDESSDEVLYEDGNDTETPGKDGLRLTSRLATTVWRGITNKTSMEPPLSPNPPLLPSTPLSPSEVKSESMDSPRAANTSLWTYADRFKDSGTVTAIAKASSNWRVKDVLGSWGRSASMSGEKEPHALPPQIPQESRESTSLERRGLFSPTDQNETYSPPPRPPYFRPPRDSFISPTTTSPSPQQEVQHEVGFMDRTRSLQASLAALTRPSTSQTKSGPRPLLLSPTTPLTSPPSRPASRSAESIATPDRGQWADVMRLKGHSPHRESVSSVSSLSPSDALRSARSSRSDWDSDTGISSRRVALNRKSVSPMAPGFRARQGRPISGSSSATSSDRGPLSPPLTKQNDLQSWSHIEKPESPVLISPSSNLSISESHQRGKELTDPEITFSNSDVAPRKLGRRMASPTYQADDTSDSSVAQAPSRSPRTRSKRFTPRPLDLKNVTATPSRHVIERKLSNSNTLAVEWPSDESATTPRASNFKGDDHYESATSISSKSLRRSRKVSTDAQDRRKTTVDDHEVRVRKVSSGQRARKVSNDQKETVRRRESSAEEGDDEGYDDLLSAYESENSQESSLR